MAEPAKAPAPEAGGGPSDDVVTRGVGKLKAMLSTNEGRALVDKFDVDADGTLDNTEIAQGLRSVLTERKHHERVRTAAIFLMGVVVAMLGIGAGLTYAVVLSLKDTEVRGNALYGTDGKGDTSPIVTSSNGVRQGTHDLHPGSKFPAGALDALVGELAVTDGNGTVVGSLAVSGIEQGDGYVLFTLRSGRCALVAEGVEGGAAVDVDCDEAIAAVEAPTSGDRRLLAALEHGPAGRRLLIHSGVLLQYRYALAQARVESAEADLAACEQDLAAASQLGFGSMANLAVCQTNLATSQEATESAEADLDSCWGYYFEEMANCEQATESAEADLDSCWGYYFEEMANCEQAAESAEADRADAVDELANCLQAAADEQDDSGEMSGGGNSNYGLCGSIDNPCLASTGDEGISTCCDEGCCSTPPYACDYATLQFMCIFGVVEGMSNNIVTMSAIGCNHCNSPVSDDDDDYGG